MQDGLFQLVCAFAPVVAAGYHITPRVSVTCMVSTVVQSGESPTEHRGSCPCFCLANLVVGYVTDYAYLRTESVLQLSIQQQHALGFP
jgi:hypothetical protein